MDFAQSALLIAALMGFVQQVKTFVNGTNQERRTAGIVLGSAVVVTFLVSASDWASSQVIADRPLDALSVWSLLLVALFLAGGASFGWEALTAVKNIGENKPLSLDKVRANIKKYPDVHKDQPTSSDGVPDGSTFAADA